MILLSSHGRRRFICHAAPPSAQRQARRGAQCDVAPVRHGDESDAAHVESGGRGAQSAAARRRNTVWLAAELSPAGAHGDEARA